MFWCIEIKLAISVGGDEFFSFLIPKTEFLEHSDQPAHIASFSGTAGTHA